MRSKSPKPSWVKFAVKPALALLAGLALTPAAHALSVTPYGVANVPVDNGSGTANTVYYLDTSYAGLYNPTFRRFNFAGHEHIQFVVSGVTGDASKQYLWAYAAPSSTGTTDYIKVALAACGGGGIDANGACAFGTNDNFTIDFDFTQICATNGANIRGCNGSSVFLGPTAISGFALRLYVATASPPGGAVVATSGTLIQVIPQVAAPTPTFNLNGYGFFPSDTSISFDTNQMVGTPDATTGGSPVFLYVYVVGQKNGTVTSGSELSSDVVQAVPYASGEQQINGFENSTTEGGKIPYEVAAGVQDSSGAIAFSPTHLTDVFATDVQGFLRESNCFVATASYRNGRAPGVMLLRHFRDEVLENFELGRDFVAWYYENGPIAADWLIAHPIFRTGALFLLMPLQAFAWITLHPSTLLAPLFALFAILLAFGLRSRKRRSFPPFFFLAALAGAALSPNARASEQPYIDSLISELPKEPGPSADRPQPYIDSLKKKMPKNAEDDATGYTEELGKEIPKSDGSEGYAERIQRTLPRESGSAIEDYRKGKKLRANKGSLDTRSAFGFDLLASATRTYTSGENTLVAYDTVYGDSWVPELSLHYEWRPFTSSFLKKFGLYASLGASFTKAQGVLDYQDPRFGSESRTQFRFIAIPANVGLIYRFSVFDFMWPYFGGGPSVIGFTETRNDKRSGNHGYDLGYWFMGGVAFGLDWISPKSSWDQYESTGVKHSYFTIDYSYLESVAGGLIEFTVDGVRLGFTFEL